MRQGRRINRLSTLLALIFLVLISHSASADRQLAHYQSFTAILPDGENCSSQMQVIVRHPSPTAFSLERVALQRTLAALRIALGYECQEVTEILINGEVGGMSQYRGVISESTDWVLVDTPLMAPAVDDPVQPSEIVMNPPEVPHKAQVENSNPPQNWVTETPDQKTSPIDLDNGNSSHDDSNGTQQQSTGSHQAELENYDTTVTSEVAYKRGGQNELISKLIEKAEQGDVEAQIALGLKYFKGEGTNKDEEEAIKWFKKAEEQGSNLAKIYLLDIEIVKRKRKKKEIGKEKETAEKELASLTREFRPQNMTRTEINIAEEIRRKEDEYVAKNIFGDEYDKNCERYYEEIQLGYERQRCIKRAVEILDWMIYGDNGNLDKLIHVAELGHAPAQYNLGLRYANGKGVTKNDTEAVKWFTRAAEQGLAKAQYNLGVRYDNGRGVTQNYMEAVKWYTRAAEQGLAQAQYNLGVSYGNGEGVAKNEAEAVKWFTRAAEQGDTKAKDALEKINSQKQSRSGEPSEKDMLKAVQNKFDAINQNFSDTRSRCERREFNNGDQLLALQCLFQYAGSGGSGNMSFQVTHFKKIDCGKARSMPGYICDFSIGYTSDSPYAQGYMNQLTGSGDIGQGRFVLNGQNWIYIPLR